MHAAEFHTAITEEGSRYPSHIQSALPNTVKYRLRGSIGDNKGQRSPLAPGLFSILLRDVPH
jgi:hypothetical protein